MPKYVVREGFTIPDKDNPDEVYRSGDTIELAEEEWEAGYSHLCEPESKPKPKAEGDKK